MKATRKTQPFKKANVQTRQGAGLKAALRGRTASGQNPMDARRAAQKGQTAPTPGGLKNALRGAAVIQRGSKVAVVRRRGSR